MNISVFFNGGLAQLARAPALHAGGHRFDSDILHKLKEQDSNDQISNPNIGIWNLENWNFFDDRSLTY